MTLSLRALTFVMSTVTSPVPMPYSAPRRASVRGVGAGDQCLGRNAAVVHAGATDEFAFDHRDCLTGGGQPARQRRTRLAGADDDRIEFLCRSCHSDDRRERDDRETADDRDGVLDKRDRQIVSAVGRDEPLARLGTAECADDGADQRRADGPDHHPRRRVQYRTRGEHCAGERTGEQPCAELLRYPPTRCLRQLVGDQLAKRQNGQHRHRDRMRDPLRPGAVEVDPAERPRPCHHRGRGQRAQTGHHTDQQSQQQNQEIRHANLSGPVKMSPGR